MEKKYAFELLKKLIEKTGEQRHFEALKTLYAADEKEEVKFKYVENEENEKLKDYLNRHVDVNLIYTDETGTWQWVLDVVENSGFWLDAFESKESARDYCVKNRLRIAMEVNHQTKERKISI